MFPGCSVQYAMFSSICKVQFSMQSSQFKVHIKKGSGGNSLSINPYQHEQPHAGDHL